MPDYVLGRNGPEWLLRNYEGNTFHYMDPQGHAASSIAYSPMIHEKVEEIPSE
ncbi:MAG: hypothetical protein P8012_09350 [Desulfobacterales bacterium]